MINTKTLLKSIFENVSDSILIMNKDGIIISANPSACILFGYESGELCKNNLSMLLHPLDVAGYQHYIIQNQKTGITGNIQKGREIKAIKKNGIVFVAFLTISDVKYNGRSAYAAVVHDLSKDRKLEEKLQQYNFELNAKIEERTRCLINIIQSLEQAKEDVKISLVKEKEVNELKTRFVSMASHEFRTPLSSIQLSASLIERYYDSLGKSKILNHLNKIKAAVSNLKATINDFLSVEKIERGEIDVVNVSFNLKEFCQDIVREVNMQLRPGQKLTYVHHSEYTTLMLDTNLLRHVLVNLLSNAVKYSGHTGLIKLETDIDDYRCFIYIKDNGIGIPEEEQANLFKAFFRASNTHSIEGTGLGLNIVKRYTNLMNGDISFISSKGSGTTFTLVFPVNGNKWSLPGT